MPLQTKSLQRIEMKRILNKKFTQMSVCEACFDGIVGLLTFLEISEPLCVPSPINNNLCIADKGYSWLQFAPRNANWWLTIMFDENNKIIEGYFDITQKNILDCHNPYFFDMKLDVVIPLNHEAVILDQDELDEALEDGCITREEYSLAIDTANQIVSNYNSNKDLYYSFIEKYFKLLKTAN